MAASTHAWYFTKSDLMKPVREGGTEWEGAVKHRRDMFIFVATVGLKLQLPQLIQSTCEVYFHRFFARRDFLDHDLHVIATACLFLAAKVEEVHRKLKDVLRFSYEFQYNERLEIDSDKYNNFKKQVLVAERLILQTIAFDLTVEHPYRFLQEHVALVQCTSEQRKDLMQMAWSFVNDSFASAVCLQFRPQLIAAAAIYLAAKNKKIELKSGGDKEWWQAANINLDELESSTSQMLEAYPQDSKEGVMSGGQQTAPSASV